jgi:hypothetical protein
MGDSCWDDLSLAPAHELHAHFDIKAVCDSLGSTLDIFPVCSGSDDDGTVWSDGKSARAMDGSILSESTNPSSAHTIQNSSTMGRRLKTDRNRRACSSDGQRSRGPKPKYVFQSKEEAIQARRERNRIAAKDSYYKRRNKVASLESEKLDLVRQNALLKELLHGIENGTLVLLGNPVEALEKLLSNDL